MAEARKPGNRAARFFKEAVDALASLVLPAPCRICEATLTSLSRIPICADCLSRFVELRGLGCEKCGRPIASPMAATAAKVLCHACRRDVYHFDLARSYAVYDDAMVRAVTLLKYSAVRPLGGWFAARLCEVMAREPEKFAADAVVPVPLHPARQRERGYNQAELIARPLARLLGIPMRAALLVRTKPRPERLKLSRRERWTSVRGAYALRGGVRVDKLRLLLVDDVFTTGATLDACSRALRRAGAERVVGLTVARVVTAGYVPVTAASSVPDGPRDAGAGERI